MTIEELQEIYQSQIKNASYHFGDPHLNIATLAGLLRIALEEYDKRHGIETKKEIKPRINTQDYL